MAIITFNIPNDKVEWVLDGLAYRFNYIEKIDNPDYNIALPIDASTNPVQIDNTLSKSEFAHSMIKTIIKTEALIGHNDITNRDAAIIADQIDIT